MEYSLKIYKHKVKVVLVEASELGLPASMTEVKEYGTNHLPQQGEFIELDTTLCRVEGFIHSTENETITIIVTKRPLPVRDANNEIHNIINI